MTPSSGQGDPPRDLDTCAALSSRLQQADLSRRPSALVYCFGEAGAHVSKGRSPFGNAFLFFEFTSSGSYAPSRSGSARTPFFVRPAGITCSQDQEGLVDLRVPGASAWRVDRRTWRRDELPAL
eukprot:scaffold374_cov271-Pinguiococcus_pyrenoidosus.AAC.18